MDKHKYGVNSSVGTDSSTVFLIACIAIVLTKNRGCDQKPCRCDHVISFGLELPAYKH